MKILFHIFLFLSLTSCTYFSSRGGLACEDVEGAQTTWSGITFVLPACWTQVMNDSDLVLVNKERDNTVTFTMTPPDTLSIRSNLTQISNTAGDTFFVVVAETGDPEAQEIIDSLSVDSP